MAILSKKSKAKKDSTTEAVVSTMPVAKVTKATTVEANEKKELFTMMPRITEKANAMGEKSNVYTFNVKGNSNKKTIAHAIKVQFKVSPLKVRIVNAAEKRVSNRGRISYRSGFKKAYVTLKKGDKIEIA